ncbi:MAG: hypothetical protein KC492_12695 [Myxococcales bacterium]|nr:hypothetical protein [Myxococcales bacterium]MCB9606209.1 hypothetical protein [Polyangiaceae bacterium]
MHRVWFAGVLGLGLAAAACGSSDGTDFGSGATGGTGGGGGSVSQTELDIVISATDAAFPHQDQLASQTATQIRAGVRMLQLEDDQGQRFTLFDSQTPVQVSYDSGASSVLSSLKPDQVPAGHYVRARLVQDWSRFDINAVLHQDNQSLQGTLNILQVTSDGVSLDGETYDSGDFLHQFSGAGGNQEFSGVLPIPDESHTAEASAFIEDGSWVVYFPVDLTLTEGQVGRLEFRANLDHAFRWSDADGNGYVNDVYDFAPPLFYETVSQFGANRFEVIVK